MHAHLRPMAWLLRALHEVSVWAWALVCQSTRVRIVSVAKSSRPHVLHTWEHMHDIWTASLPPSATNIPAFVPVSRRLGLAQRKDQLLGTGVTAGTAALSTQILFISDSGDAFNSIRPSKRLLVGHIHSSIFGRINLDQSTFKSRVAS